MYSILFSKISDVSEEHLNKCKNFIKISKLAIFPWTFASENMPDLHNDFFEKGGRHFEKYITQMNMLGISSDKLLSINPYQTNRKDLIKILQNCDGIFIPGGNPEMFMTIAIRLNVMDLFTTYSKTIIGESAGSVLQFPLYGLPEQNNFYKCNSFYNGFGAIKCDFSIDVHTQDSTDYLNNLNLLASSKNIKILTIPNESCLIINRKNLDIVKLGKINTIYPHN